MFSDEQEDEGLLLAVGPRRPLMAYMYEPLANTLAVDPAPACPSDDSDADDERSVLDNLGPADVSAESWYVIL